MTDTVIRVENLGKRYRIGAAQKKPRSGREALVHFVKSPFRYLGRALTSPPEEEILWALRNVSFEVKRGEVIGIIGRNGAGKSTLLKILSRITEPTEGRAELHGRVASLLEVGVGFNPELTGRENIYLNGAILGMSRADIRKRFDEIVAFSEVEKFLDTPVKHYSSGMYVRLAFAVAAHLEPEILVVDEVLAVGDAAFQKKCLGKMGDVAREGRTVLLVSHGLQTVGRLCSRALLLRGGEVEMSGEANHVIEHYLGSMKDAATRWERQPPFPEGPHFRRAFVCGPDGGPCESPSCAGRLGVDMEFCLPKSMGRIMLGIGVQNNEREYLVSSVPEDDSIACPQEPGVYHARVLFPPGLFLAKGYALTLVLYDYGRRLTFDRLESALSFQVREVAAPSNDLHPDRTGDFFIPCKWSLTKLAAGDF